MKMYNTTMYDTVYKIMPISPMKQSSGCLIKYTVNFNSHEWPHIFPKQMNVCTHCVYEIVFYWVIVFWVC